MSPKIKCPNCKKTITVGRGRAKCTNCGTVVFLPMSLPARPQAGGVFHNPKRKKKKTFRLDRLIKRILTNPYFVMTVLLFAAWAVGLFK